MAPRGMSSTAYQRLRAITLAASNVCSWCGHPIDMRLSGRHRDGPTFDHTTARANGGHVLGPGTPMHNRCNAQKGARKDAKPLKTSRAW